MKRFTQKMLASAMAATLAVSALSLGAITAYADNLTTPTQGATTPAVGVLARSIALNKTKLTVATGQALKGEDLLSATISPNNVEIQDVTWSLAATAADLAADKTHGTEAYEAALEELATAAGEAVYTEAGLAPNTQFTDATIDLAKQYKAPTTAQTTVLEAAPLVATDDAVEGQNDANADYSLARYNNTKALIKNATYGSATSAMLSAFNGVAVADDTKPTVQEINDAVAAANTQLQAAQLEVKEAVVTAANTALASAVTSAKTAARKNTANITAAKEAQNNVRLIDDQGYYKDATNNGVISIVKVAADGKVDTSANADKLNKYIQVVGISEGQTTIRVQTTDGSNKSAVCTVIVKASVPVDPAVGVGFKLKEDELTLGTDSTAKLTPVIQGVRDVDNKVQTATATADDIEWASSDPTVLTVDEKGVITPKKAGTAYVTATLTDEFAVGGATTYTYNTTVTVTEPVAVTDITLDKTSGSVAVGESIQVKATISPLTASNKKITWSSQDPSIATVEQVGDVTEGNTTYTVAKITGKKSGTTTIIATTQSGTKTALYTVTVGATGSKVVNDTGVTLNVLSGTLLVGETAELQAIITPENATNKELQWISTDPAVATVEAVGPITKNGTTRYCASVKALQKGITTVRVKTASGNYAECLVTVSDSGMRDWNETKVGILDVNNSTYDLKDTTSRQINFQPTPSSAKVTWTSSDTNVATVDANGLVTFKKAGTVTITGTIQNGTAKVTESTTMVIKDTRGNTNPTTSEMALTVDGRTPLHLLKIANENRKFQIIPVFGVAGYSANDVKWNSSDTRYFPIDANGWITYNQVLMGGQTSYQATITATTYDNKYSASFTIISYATLTSDTDDLAKLTDGVKITYNNNVVTSLKAKWKSNLKDYSYKLDSLLSGTKYTKSQLVWTVDKPELASIDQTGTLKIIATEDQVASNPVFTVKCASNDGAISATCAVTISKNYSDGEADIYCNDPAYVGDPFTMQFDGKDVADGGTVGLTAPKSGSDGYQARALLKADAPIDSSDITWSSSDRSVADVDSTGKVTVYPVTKDKTVTITAKATKNGTSWSKSFKLNVSPAPEDNVDIVDPFEFNPDTLSLTVGDPAKKVNPDGSNAVKWTSSKPSVAEVDSNGNITPKAAGTAVITAEDANGQKAKLTVTVKAAATPTSTDDGNYITMTPEQLEDLINKRIAAALDNQGGKATVTDPTTTNTGKIPTGNPKTGVALAVVPAVLAGAGVVVFRKRRK